MNEPETILFLRFSKKKSKFFTTSINFNNGFSSVSHIDNFCHDTILQLFGDAILSDYINYKLAINSINNEFCNKLNLKFLELKKEACYND